MKPTERQAARELRSQGFSIKEICQLLKVSKSTVSLWVRDILLTPEQIARPDAKIACCRQRFAYLSRCDGANTNKEDAEKRHYLFRQAGFNRASKDDSFRLICALYWGEGRKRGRVFGICNSDPPLLNTILKWLVANGYDDAIRFTVRYHPDNGLSETDIRQWWVTQLPQLKERHLRRFGQCTAHRASQRKMVGKLPYGTASLEVCRTELYSNVMGGIDFLREKGDW